MSTPLLADVFWTHAGGRTLLHAMPLILGVLCVLAIAYRYYSAFLAARVLALDDRRLTPAHVLEDGQNYHPTNQWVLFGHHFAAISGAGPLIGPVLAIQYGYMPGLLWLVVGVCLAGAVQDMLVLGASVRRGGRSLAEIARAELGPWAMVVVRAAILFIVIIALAGLGLVVVKALGGDEVSLAKGMTITLPDGAALEHDPARSVYSFPARCELRYPAEARSVERPESFTIGTPGDVELTSVQGVVTLPAGCQQLVKGSSWGTFTIACTIPIALVVGLYMYRLRKGRVVEASLIGAALTIAAVVVGNWIPGSALEGSFSLTRGQTVLALIVYGFVASVLPVWLLLCPRDYLSSFLKIGTIILLIAGVCVANPILPCPMLNDQFVNGGPTFQGGLFPFVFICIMCGAISGFHALVSSGTTPKMIDRESQVRFIGYGAMLMEGLVGIVALIAAASLDPGLYYDINVSQEQAASQKWADQLQVLQDEQNRVYADLGTGGDIVHMPVEKRDLNHVEHMVGNESLRGRTGGAVTLAVGMSFILSDALAWSNDPAVVHGLLKYWYHFAIMFEALFILTTIDTGTRIARFLVQEGLGHFHPLLGQTDWLPGAALATTVVTLGWGVLVYTGSIDTIWPMFGIANQLLAVLALALVTTVLVNTGRSRYLAVTVVPMLFVTATTLTAAREMIWWRFLPGLMHNEQVLKNSLNLIMTVFVVLCVTALLLLAVCHWILVLSGRRRPGGVSPRILLEPSGTEGNPGVDTPGSPGQTSIPSEV
jgi:carbon starvation protein